jgi:methyl-accepting chemotaxis protein
MMKTKKLEKEIEGLYSDKINLEKELKKLIKESLDYQLECTEKAKEIASLKDELRKKEIIFENKEKIKKDIEKARGRLEELQIGTDASTSHIEELSSFIEEISSTTEESASTISQISGNIASIKEMTTLLDDNSYQGISHLSTLAEKIKKIKDDSGYIKEVVDLIVNINEQIKLFSFNALIEAAHAGNAGKGFNIVADAIRELSERVTPQISHIKDNIKNIVNNIEESVKISTSTKEKFDNIKNQVDETKNAVTEISVAIDEQTAVTQQISNSISGKIENIKEIKMLLDDVVEQNKLSLEAFENLE